MANISIKFNNKEFLLSCDDGQEEHLEELLIQINKKFNELLVTFPKSYEDDIYQYYDYISKKIN